jgi:hypothetical protein
MPPDAPVLRRSSTGARTAELRTDRRSAVCTARVRCGDGEARGAVKLRCLRRGTFLGKVCGPRAACDLKRQGIGRRTGADAEGAGDVVVQHALADSVLLIHGLSTIFSKTLY